MRRSYVLGFGAGLLSILLLALLACAPKSAAPSAPQATSKEGDWAQVVEAAKKEAKVVIYGPIEPGTRDAMVPLFKKKYPSIDVEVVYGAGPQSAEKLRTEAAAGKPVGDIWHGGTTPAVLMREEGLLTKFRAPTLVREADKYIIEVGDEQGYLNNVYLSDLLLLVNTNLIKPQDEPKSWFDLGDPKYKGKIIMNDPRRPSGGSYVFWVLAQKYPKETQELIAKMAKQDVSYVPSPAQLGDEVARGEKAIALGGQNYQMGTHPGAPMKALVPKEGYVYVPLNAVIAKQAPHPNAARLWIDFEASREVQQSFADTGVATPIRSDVTPNEKFPWITLAGKPRLGTLPYDKTVQGSYVADVTKLFEPVFGK